MTATLPTESCIGGWKVAAMYHFGQVTDPAAFKADLLDFCRKSGIFGTLIVAGEGLNGTVAGSDAAISALVRMLEARFGAGAMELKYSHADEQPFHRMKVRLKREIVTMGVEGLDPVHAAGTYVSPREWDRLTADPATIIIDTRNDYEVALGAFEGAVDPLMTSFREFPAWLEQQKGQLVGRKLAMYCTGGIRCEKATAYARSIGLEEVYHLKGGILKYLEDIPEEDSTWRGECFVFDERVALTHGLVEGEAELCRACRRPLTPTDRADPRHQDGISCVYCHEARSDDDRLRYAERQRQVRLAEKKGLRHIGG